MASAPLASGLAHRETALNMATWFVRVRMAPAGAHLGLLGTQRGLRVRITKASSSSARAHASRPCLVRASPTPLVADKAATTRPMCSAAKEGAAAEAAEAASGAVAPLTRKQLMHTVSFAAGRHTLAFRCRLLGRHFRLHRSAGAGVCFLCKPSLSHDAAIPRHPALLLAAPGGAGRGRHCAPPRAPHAPMWAPMWALMWALPL